METRRPFRRALLKISGEAFAGDRGFGMDPTRIQWIANQVRLARDTGCEIGVVVGAGNIIRGADAASVGVPPLVGDQMGMIATVLNAMTLRASLETLGVEAVVMSAFQVGVFVELFEAGRARSRLGRGLVVIFAGGTGNPCFTTDSAAALRAVEIDAEVMIKGTQVPGVFDKDPKKHSDAVMFETITAQEVIRRQLGVIDAASVEILGRKGIPVVVLDLHREGNLAAAVAGESVGTLIR
jgi:uridylate kinase